MAKKKPTWPNTHSVFHVGLLLNKPSDTYQTALYLVIRKIDLIEVGEHIRVLHSSRRIIRAGGSVVNGLTTRTRKLNLKVLYMQAKRYIFCVQFFRNELNVPNFNPTVAKSSDRGVFYATIERLRRLFPGFQRVCDDGWV